MGHKGKLLVAGLLIAGGVTTYVVETDEPKKAASFLDLPVQAVDAEKESALVSDEDRRLNQIRSVNSVNDKKLVKKLKDPYRLSTGAGYTLILVERKTPYTIADLVKLAPQTFVRQSDGSYLLSENIYVNSGATLSLYNPGGLTLRLASSPAGFVSIVSFGGNLRFAGAANAPMKVVSWDARAGKPDKDPRDGRAYLRAVGGQLTVDYTSVEDLGFWSGRTGGLSATGTDRPNTGATVSEQNEHRTKDQRHQDKKDRQEKNKTPQEGPVTPRDGSSTVLPSGALPVPGGNAGTDVTTPDQSFVNLTITRSKITGNAYGMFVSGANGVQMNDVTVENSMVHGVVLHRFTYNGRIERTLSRNNRGDGFVISRAAHDIRITGSTAEGNYGNGFTLNGQALAKGPSAAGESIEPYGNNTIENCYGRNNKRYGIEVLGGINVSVQNNEVSGGDMGIVVRQGAQHATIVGNQVKQPKRQGISIRDGVTDSAVTGNVIDGVTTGIYVRDANPTVRSNSIEGATLHGVTLVGSVGGSLITFNTVTGAGPSAIDKARSHGSVKVEKNQTFGWHDTSSLWVQIKRVLSPLTLIWCLIIFVLGTSAVQARRRKKFGVVRGVNPYDKQVHLVELPVQELARDSQSDHASFGGGTEPPSPNGTREKVLAE
ncbi:right-handed parallel beta-helix repeat-containing protein [Actinocorallia longicatena]|uniref:Right handed beta helix domain-containing protein n=1 Tax=Actinocorallia longicatena TaxID=111803 RepID=A0ABP6QMT6_9ACTN